MGLTIRHLGHDESTITPGAGDIRIEEVYVRAPVDWSLGTGISQAQAGLVYAYDRVSIGNFIGRNEGAVGVYSNNEIVVLVFVSISTTFSHLGSSRMLKC